ncbi:MAG: 2-oxoacid:acceptor oxidoreductase family protein [Burkholderiales bacterium]|nr:2-oxoacid:acceptor oxidoreductase family protein [Burkholderiales bacterium]
MYRIRFHGRGGQGMKTASCILGDAFFAEGFEVQDAPRYGAERRGAPIFAYVRADRAAINERGIIARPDLVVVADDTLVTVPAAAVLQGVGARTVLLICSNDDAATWTARLKRDCRVLTLPAPAAPEAGQAQAGVGALCAGAAAALVGVIGRAALERAVAAELAAHGAPVVARNTAQALAAYDALAAHQGLVSAGGAVDAGARAPVDWIDLAAEDAAAAAPDIHATATSLKAATGLWRVMRPVIDHAHCHKCSWICSTLCPDSAIAVDADHAPRIDYDHCKGCLVCVAVCPSHAIRAIPERGAAGAVP